MAFLLLSRNFNHITEYSPRCFNTSVVKKLNKAVSILDSHSLNQPSLNIEIKKELSTSMEKFREGQVHTTNISSKQSDTFLPLLNHQHSISFWGKTKNFPVKCKIKCNDCGERIAEPYIAKKPTPIDFARLPKDFTMNFEHKCEKLRGNEFKCKSETEIKPRLTKRTLKCQREAPNALTKYLEKQDKCNNIFRGNKEACVRYMQKKDECNCVFKGNQKINVEENSSPTNVATTALSQQSKPNKAKKLVQNLISKLKWTKLMKPSGFISEDLITEAIKRLRINFPKNKRPLRGLTCAKETLASVEMPNCEKSLVRKFGERSKTQQFSIQPKFVEDTSFDETTKGKPSIRSKISTKNNLAKSNFEPKIVKDNMNRNKGSNIKLKRTEDNKAIPKRDNASKPYEDVLPIQGDLSIGDGNVKKKTIKPKRQNMYKPKSRHGGRLRKRKRRFSFSKIPIQPNVKGSVIFVNGAPQPLEDPCKILSVNFFNNDDIAFEDLKKEDDGIHEYNTAIGQFTAIKAKSNGFIRNIEVKKIPTKAKIFQGYGEERRYPEKEKADDNSNIEGKKNQYSEGEVLLNMRTRKFDNLKKKDEKYCRSYSPPEPIIRRKKISKLDKNITSFVTTVFPEEKLSKSLSKFKKNKSFQEKFGFISLEDEGEEISTDILLGVRDDPSNESREKHKAKSASSIGSDFYRKIADTPNFNSEESISRTNETAESKEKISIVDNLSRGKGGFKKGITVSPGLTRPVTQKTAHLDILKTKPFAPISNMWKKNTASTGRLASNKRNRKKKTMRSTDNLAILETKDNNMQQTRWKSTTSWKTKCECDEKRCSTDKKDYDEKANCLYPLPVDWDYEGAAPPHLARKWATRECPQAEDIGCPITSDDMKKGPPCKRPLSAAALNRCNYNECKNRMRRRKCCYSGVKKTIGTGC